MKVKIIKASKPSYWYADKIGEEFVVHEDSKFPDDYSSPDGFLLISKQDCQLTSWGIDSAWDTPKGNIPPEKEQNTIEIPEKESILSPSEQAYYRFPETKGIVSDKKKSAEQWVAEIFNQQQGTSLTGKDVVSMMYLVASLKKLEK